jgi:spermidine/putrescine transport system substrate-binding protein
MYNTAVTHRPVTSMRDLLTSPDLRGKVSLATEMRDVLTLVMLDMGIDPMTFTSGEFSAAVAALGKAAQAGQFGLLTDYYGPALLRGTIGAAVGWSGDYLNFRLQNPHIGFTMPRAGGGLWTDNMVILANARHALDAERLMNFYYEPAIAAQLSAYESYVDPVGGAQLAARAIDPALAAESYVFPTPDLLRDAHFFKLLTPSQNASYTARYQSAVGL